MFELGHLISLLKLKRSSCHQVKETSVQMLESSVISHLFNTTRRFTRLSMNNVMISKHEFYFSPWEWWKVAHFLKFQFGPKGLGITSWRSSCSIRVYTPWSLTRALSLKVSYFGRSPQRTERRIIGFLVCSAEAQRGKLSWRRRFVQF